MDGDKAGWTGAGRLGTARGSAKPSFLTRLDNSYKFPTDAFRSVWLTPHLAIFRISNSHRKAPGAKPSFSLRLVPFSSSRRMLSGRCGSPPASRFSEIRIHNVRRRSATPCFSLRLGCFSKQARWPPLRVSGDGTIRGTGRLGTAPKDGTDGDGTIRDRSWGRKTLLFYFV